VVDPSKQLDLFPTSEPEIKGQLAACAVVVRGLIETLIANGSLTKEQAVTLLYHADLKSAFAIWDELQGEMPESELRRMEEQATRFLESLWRDIVPER
jgi:polyhydroxyalkanoate synthesis regulator phasin